MIDWVFFSLNGFVLRKKTDERERRGTGFEVKEVGRGVL